MLVLAKKVDTAPFKKSLEQLFVTDEYGVFGRERTELRESARKVLKLERNKM